MPLPRDTAGRETRDPALVNTGLYSTGDYVVPRYSETGRKEVAGQVLGDSRDIVGLAQKMAAHAVMGGAEMLPVVNASIATKKKSRKPTPQRASNVPVVVNEAVVPILRTDGLDPNVVKVGSTVPDPVVNTILQPCSPPTLRAQADVPQLRLCFPPN